MKDLFTIMAAAMASLFPLVSRAADSPRERLNFDAGWHFQKGDPAGVGDTLGYNKIKGDLLASTGTSPAAVRGNPGEDVAFEKPDFDDSGWRTLNLPHDWGIEGPFNQAYPGETAKLPWWGIAWYRKHFDVAASEHGRQFFLDVDGAMAYAAVWLNGHFVGGWPYGYASWRVDLTPFIRTGGNVLAIRLDNPPDSSRWYPGGGIYRNVWLVKTAPVHVGHWGTYITTPEVSPSSATVDIKVQVDNAGSIPVGVITHIFQAGTEGQPLGQPIVASPLAQSKGGPQETPFRSSFEVQIPNPRLWSLESPNLYVAVTDLVQNHAVIDRYETVFGIRTIQFTVDRGFLLNGKHVALHGVCDHSDLGALGTAINDRGLQRQLEILKSMGCNAIRTSHNPPAPELLDLCDRMGFLVMDEFADCWSRGKKPNGYNLLYPDWHEKDLRAYIRRDRNHPCVILWSIGNEIPEQGSELGNAEAAELTGLVHEEDPTRPSTVACSSSGAGYSGYQKAVDVFGYNYKPFEYAKFRQANPGIPLFGSETASCISSRGEYFFPVSEKKSGGLENFQVSSYDLYAPGWATSPDTEFKGQDENPFVAGEFVWTGFDYLGEPTPYNHDMTNLLNFNDPQDKARAEDELKAMGKVAVPSRSSYFGIVDLAGFPKDRYYLYQARWRPDLPMAHILPHWNWPERVGQVTPVFVYTSGDAAELFLNGKSLGRKQKQPGEYRLRWDDVKYEPGELKALAYKNGRLWAQDAVKTTGPAARIILKADRETIKADGADLSYVTATIVDAEGLPVPRSSNLIKFSIGGPAEIVATDNGDATDHTIFSSPQRRAFNSLALAIVRSKPGVAGDVTLAAESEGLGAGRLVVKATGAAAP